jgi:hypothetical protein
VRLVQRRRKPGSNPACCLSVSNSPGLRSRSQVRLCSPWTLQLHSNAYIGLFGCWAVLLPLAWAIQSYWGPIAYAAGITALEGLFCLGLRSFLSWDSVYDVDPRLGMADGPHEDASGILPR